MTQAAQPLSAHVNPELDDLQTLRTLIERAISDGILTEAEKNSIHLAVWADGKVLPEEVALVQELVWDKLERGELQMQWNNPHR